jgi:large subunit ribosomal protein L30
MDKVLVKQVRSEIGRNPAVRSTLKALGLRGIGKSREIQLTAAVKGMVKKVQYLLEVTPAK